MIGRFAGAPIYLQWSWFPLMGMIILGYGMKLSSWQSLSTSQGYLAAVILASTLALGVFFHELAHAAVGRAHKAKVTSITLNMWGGQTHLSASSASTALYVALAGPVMNFLVAGVSYLLWCMTGTGAFYGFYLAVQVNFAVGLFNLLPAFPLDGGYALEALIFLLTGSRSKAQKIVTYISFLLLAFSLSFFVFLGLWQNPLTFVIGFLLMGSIVAGLLSAVQKLGMNSDKHHPLHAQQLICSVTTEHPATLIKVASQHWDGQSNFLLFEDHPVASNRPHSVILGSTFEAARYSLADQPLAAISQALEARTLPPSTGPTDILDIFQGFASYEDPTTVSSDDRIWLVVDNNTAIGTISARDIATAVTKVFLPAS